MRKTEWTENQLEEVLKQMPKIRDNRDSHELYRAISSNIQKKKRPVWIFPSIATAAACALLFMLLPNLLSWESQTKEEKKSESSQEFVKKEMNDHQADSIALKNSDASMANESAKQTDSEMLKNTSANQELARTAIYQDDLVESELLTYAIPDVSGQNIVPISVRIPQDKSKPRDEQFITTMTSLSESEWGLQEYFPLNANVAFNQNKQEVTIDVPVDHPYGKGSTAEVNFIASLEQTFRYLNIKRIIFTTDGKPGIVLGNNELQSLDVTTKQQRAIPYFLLYVEGQYRPFLVPYNQPVSSMEEAWRLMQKDVKASGLQAPIPSHVTFDKVTKNKDLLTITFSNEVQIEPTSEMIYMIEAILLTAKELGYKSVEFKNTNTTTLGTFQFEQPIAVPIAPNFREILQ